MHYHSTKANAVEQKVLRKSLRNHATSEEAMLWRLLKGRGVGGWKFRRQQGVGPYVLDFYCPELRLCVEIDGDSHCHKFAYDEQRTVFLNQQGICVLRFRNEMIWTDVNAVVSEILRAGKELSKALEDADGALITDPSSEAMANGVITDPTPAPPLQGRGAG